MHYEACSLQTIRNAVNTFSKMKIIKISDSRTAKREINVEVLVNEDHLQTFGEKIHFFLKTSYQGSKISPV